MAEKSQPTRIDYPSPSIVSGPLYNYLTRLASAINEIPVLSFYSGNPLSVITANPGTLLVNVASSANTSRLWQKRQGSGTTGWVSVATV